MDSKNITDRSLDEFLATLDPEAKNWRPVEFRCMIQDILGNEIYAKHNSDKFGDRTIFYCITIPGENEWVRSCPKGSKNEFMTNNGLSYPESATSAQENTNTTNNLDLDRDKNSRLSFSLVNWSYPIPSDGKNKSCLIKVYDINLVEYLRVNDIVQVSGLVEPIEFEDDSLLMTNKNSPINGEFESDHNPLPTSNNSSQQLLDSDFEPASDFPHRLVPRVHVRTLKKLNHINPLLPDMIIRDKIDKTMVKLARARLSTILTQLFGGDSLVADYLILSLISKIHRRKDVTTLGQLTIGISGVKPEMKFLIDKLYEIISRITTHSHYIDMSIANLNNLRFTSKKDHDNNKMIAGTLQLPDGLYLMLNETALTEGQLTAQGTENLSTLNQIIRWQRHNYNFKFHSVEIDTDLKVLIVSEGKSILSVPYDVRIENNDPESIASMRQACDSVNDFLTEDLLNMFRYFITALKDVPEYAIPDDVQKSIQEDFVNWRRGAEANGKTIFSADDLSSYMTLARYKTISQGETTLTNVIWKETCQMEYVRQSRLQLNSKPSRHD